MDSRPAIPAALRRKILVEAGHRCAIPTCRFRTTEIAHITPYAKVREHAYPNLIALCPNCHTRFDRGEIDRLSMTAYKQKMAFVSDRYTGYEMRVMEYLSEHSRVTVHGTLQVKTLLDEELIEKVEDFIINVHDDGFEEVVEFMVALTTKGRAFLEAWRDPTSQELSYERADV